MSFDVKYNLSFDILNLNSKITLDENGSFFITRCLKNKNIIINKKHLYENLETVHCRCSNGHQILMKTVLRSHRRQTGFSEGELNFEYNIYLLCWWEIADEYKFLFVLD